MSACIFTLSNKSIASMTVGELKKLVSDKAFGTGKFLEDMTAGMESNRHRAELELMARSYFEDPEVITSMVLREGYAPYDFTMRAAISKSYKTNEPVDMVFEHGRLRLK